MNRKLLALSIAAVLSAPAAAQDTGPTIYGRLHLSLSYLDNGDDGEPNVSSHASRLGIKGGHALSESLEGLYQIESQIDADNGTGSLASRNTFVGLKGGFGTLRVGNLDTPVKEIVSTIDLFNDAVGDLDNITRRSHGHPVDERVKNAIAYTSPSFGGVAIDVFYSTNFGAAPNSDADDDTIAVAATFKQGPLYASLGYQSYGDELVYVSGASAVAGNGEDRASAIRLGGYYDLGALRLIGLLQQTLDDPRLQDATLAAIGARYRFGKYAVKAQLATLDADAPERDATLIAVGGEYQLAKSLTGYLAYARTDNDDASTLSPYRDLTDGAALATPGETGSAFSLGAIYNF